MGQQLKPRLKRRRRIRRIKRLKAAVKAKRLSKKK